MKTRMTISSLVLAVTVLFYSTATFALQFNVTDAINIIADGSVDVDECFKLFLRYCVNKRNLRIECITISMMTRDLILEFLTCMAKEGDWSAQTWNLRLAALKSFCRYVQSEQPLSILNFFLVKINSFTTCSFERDFLWYLLTLYGLSKLVPSLYNISKVSQSKIKSLFEML